MSRSAWLALALLGALAGPAPAADDLAAGDAALRRFDLAAALTAYQRAGQAAPDNYEATWKLARALADKSTLTQDAAEQKRLVTEAVRLARAAVRLRPKDSKGHVYLAITVGKLALYEGGQRQVELSKEAQAEAEQARELNPQEDLAWHVLGVWNREMVELNWALRIFAELIYGKFPPASLATAEADLRRAAALAPTLVPHHVELGITLAAARRWTEADAELEKALAMPQAWVTDPYYWQLARKTLARVKPRLH